MSSATIERHVEAVAETSDDDLLDRRLVRARLLTVCLRGKRPGNDEEQAQREGDQHCITSIHVGS
jgi:hypothetical protein